MMGVSRLVGVWRSDNTVGLVISPIFMWGKRLRLRLLGLLSKQL